MSSAITSRNGRVLFAVGMMWSVVANVRSGRATGQFLARSSANACGVVTWALPSSFVVDGGCNLTNVMQKSTATSQIAVQTQLLSHQTRQMSHLNRMLTHVLTVTDPEMQPTHQIQNLRMQTANPSLFTGLQAQTPDVLVHLLRRLCHDLLNTRRMNPTILNQLDQRSFANLTTHIVKRRNNHDTRSIIDNHIHTRSLLKCPDVTPLTTDNPTLHVVIRNVHSRDRGF